MSCQAAQDRPERVHDVREDADVGRSGLFPDADQVLGRIRRLITVTPDTALRPEIMSILDER
jgi:hypothetical protein